MAMDHVTINLTMIHPNQAPGKKMGELGKSPTELVPLKDFWEPTQSGKNLKYFVLKIQKV